jgi:phage baseplate assembly protein gpV
LEQQIRGQKEFEATVEDVDDPEGLNRIRVTCPSIWGEDLSPWLIDRTGVGGNGAGEVYTPTVGDRVSVRLRDGNPDAGEWHGGHRSERATPPEEFSDPKVNGFKTPGGTIVTYDDNEQSYTVENEAGGKIKLMSDGSVEIWGTHCKVHTTAELNSDSPQYGVVTESPSFICPYSGKPHKGSSTVKAAD